MNPTSITPSKVLLVADRRVGGTAAPANGPKLRGFRLARLRVSAPPSPTGPFGRPA